MRMTIEAHLAKLNAKPGKDSAAFPVVAGAFETQLRPTEIADLARFLEQSVTIEVDALSVDVQLRAVAMQPGEVGEAPSVVVQFTAPLSAEKIGGLARLLDNVTRSVRLRSAQMSFEDVLPKGSGIESVTLSSGERSVTLDRSTKAKIDKLQAGLKDSGTFRDEVGEMLADAAPGRVVDGRTGEILGEREQD